MNPTHFFSVSLLDNIEILQETVPRLNHFYETPKISIVCPEQELESFNFTFKQFNNVTLISEDSIISFKEFCEVTFEIANNLGVEISNKDRLGWYYQQALKLTYFLKYVKKNERWVMWDADTIPLVKIELFKDGEAVLYGSALEYHEPYFQTLQKIVETLPNFEYGFTIQFFNSTYEDALFIQSKFNKIKLNIPSVDPGRWVSTIMIECILNAHQTLCGSLFSEQECVGVMGIARLWRQQKILLHLRTDLAGKLSVAQMRVASLLGFKHLTYEQYGHLSKRKQPWLTFIYSAAKAIVRQRVLFGYLGK